MEGLGREAVRRHDTELVGEALARLGEVEDLELYGPRDPEIRAGVFSFNFPGVHPHDLSAALDAEGVAVRAGHHCAQPLMRRLGVAGTARASFFVHTGADDIAALAAALQRARELLGAGRLRPVDALTGRESGSGRRDRQMSHRPWAGSRGCPSLSCSSRCRLACAAAAEPLRIRYAVWVGYGPLFLAQQKGYFAAEKVEVQLVKMEDPKESFRRWARVGSTESSRRSTP